ncbi:hypothetical protein IWX92DRAFT_51856 [Phyllosticta citricarpa]
MRIKSNKAKVRYQRVEPDARKEMPQEPGGTRIRDRTGTGIGTGIGAGAGSCHAARPLAGLPVVLSPGRAAWSVQRRVRSGRVGTVQVVPCPVPRSHRASCASCPTRDRSQPARNPKKKKKKKKKVCLHGDSTKPILQDCPYCVATLGPISELSLSAYPRLNYTAFLPLRGSSDTTALRTADRRPRSARGHESTHETHRPARWTRSRCVALRCGALRR